MSLFCALTAQTALAQASAQSPAQELRIVSRNSLVFIDSVREGEPRAEWAPYRVVDEMRPVIFKVDGPGRLVIKLRTFLEATNREAIGVVLRDDTIVLTARVPAVRDPDVKLVESGKNRATRARTFVVRVDGGAHTIAVRYSEGPSLLAFASFSPGLQREIVAGEEGEVPLVDPRENGNEAAGVARVGKVSLDGEVVEELAADGESASVETTNDDSSLLAQKEAWTKKKQTAPTELASRSGPALEADEHESPFKPNDAALAGRKQAPRTLTQRAPYLSLEARGGVLMSRLGLDVAPLIGADARIPIPRLDARRFTIGVSVDASYARGQAAVISEGTRAAVDVATIVRTAIDTAVDVRVVIARVADVLDPYVGAGAGVTVAALSTRTLSGTIDETRVDPLGVLRIGAAFGDIGSRPFIEVSGAVAPKDAMVKAAVGYRFEILGDVPTD